LKGPVVPTEFATNRSHETTLRIIVERNDDEEKGA
jgi:hypothetical protein